MILMQLQTVNSVQYLHVARVCAFLTLLAMQVTNTCFEKLGWPLLFTVMASIACMFLMLSLCLVVIMRTYNIIKFYGTLAPHLYLRLHPVSVFLPLIALLLFTYLFVAHWS